MLADGEWKGGGCGEVVGDGALGKAAAGTGMLAAGDDGG